MTKEPIPAHLAHLVPGAAPFTADRPPDVGVVHADGRGPLAAQGTERAARVLRARLAGDCLNVARQLREAVVLPARRAGKVGQRERADPIADH